MFKHLLDAFTDQISTQPNGAALVASQSSRVVSLTWIELASRVADRVDLLQRKLDGAPEQQRIVGYSSTNSLDDVVTAIACPILGAIEAPLDSGLSEARRFFDEKVGGYWLAAQPERQPNQHQAIELEDVLTRLAPRYPIDVGSPALILWTSGTTSEARGVTLSHRNLLGNAEAKLMAVPQQKEDIRLTALPICHAYARTCDLGTWLLSGCTLAIGAGYEAWRTLGAVVRPTLANTVPSLAKRLFVEKANVGADRLRLLGCGGAAMASDGFDAWEKRGVTVIQGYGLTEAGPVICSATPENAAPGLVGEFVNGWEHRIHDSRLFVRGPHVMCGYWNDAHATQCRIDRDGWLDTRDAVEVDAATGQIRILGRCDDVVILSNGYKVHPQSIEKDIEQIDGVRYAMVVGAGRSIQVWIDAQPTKSLKAEVENRLSHRPVWQHPSAVHFFKRPLSAAAGELTAKGSIRRAAIRQSRSIV